jgi:hypothetical protein
VPTGRPASPEAEIVVVTGGRVAEVTLRGRSATRRGRREVRTALEGLTQVFRVLDASDLEAFRASDKLGDFVIEARAP